MLEHGAYHRHVPRYDAATALIIVDVQNDFADPAGSLYVPRWRDGRAAHQRRR